MMETVKLVRQVMPEIAGLLSLSSLILGIASKSYLGSIIVEREIIIRLVCMQAFYHGPTCSV